MSDQNRWERLSELPPVTDGQVGDLYWHVHHDVLAEVLTVPIEYRIDYINTEKPESERAIRLRWMTPVLTLDDPAWANLDRAWYDRNRAEVDWNRVRADYDQAWADCDRAVADWDRAGADRDRAQVDRDRAQANLDQAWADCDRAEADLTQAWADVTRTQAALAPLHALEHPGCPWDGRTLVFPKVPR